MNMIRSTRTPPGYYERCSDEATLDEAKDLLDAAINSLGDISFDINQFDGFAIKLRLALKRIEAANNSKLDDAKKIVSEALSSLEKLETETYAADEIVCAAIKDIENIEHSLHTASIQFAEDTPLFDENTEHRTY